MPFYFFIRKILSTFAIEKNNVTYYMTNVCVDISMFIKRGHLISKSEL